MLRRLLLSCVVACAPSVVWAQTPVGGTVPPIWVAPGQQGSASNPFTNVVFTWQALGPDSCTAYSFSSATTTGYGYDGSSLCMNLAGSTIFSVSSGAVQIDGGASTIRSILNANNNVERIFSFRTAGSPRWALRVDGNETGANAGADFAIRRYTDAGAFIDAPFSIARSTGTITAGPATISSSLFSSTAPYRGSEFSATTGAVSIGAVSSEAINFFTANTTKWQISISGDLTPFASGVSYLLASKAWINTAPTGPVACTSPTVTNSNGSAFMTIDVGTSCTGITTLVVTMPTVTTGYGCAVTNLTTAAAQPVLTSSTTGSITITNYSRTTGLATDWVDGADVRVTCTGG